MAVTLSLFAGAGAQFFDNNGNVLSGGKIYTYFAGTTTPLGAYTTSAGSAFHTNPIVLDSAGRVPNGGEIWLTVGVGYKFVLQTSSNVTIATYDNVPSSAQPPAANNANSIMYEQGYTVTAGNFVVGQTYRITFVGTTDFALIGAVSNTVGTYFIATGVGSGTGIAEVSETVATKFLQTISVQDFGAVGDWNGTQSVPGTGTDDTAAIQAAIDYCLQTGAELFFPPGRYRTTAPLVIDRTFNNQDPINGGMYGISLRGGGAASCQIASDHNGVCIDFRGGASAGWHTYFYIDGLGVLKANYGKNVGSIGFKIDQAAYMQIQRFDTYGFEYGIYGIDVLSSAFMDGTIRGNQYGFRFEKGTRSHPNNISFRGVQTINNNTYGGALYRPSVFSYIGGSIESNGYTGVLADPNSWGLYVESAGTEGSVGINMQGVYIENNNGKADVWILQSINNVIHNFNGCSFLRFLDTRYVTNCILFNSTNDSRLSINGCGFKDYTPYVSDASRLWIAAGDAQVFDGGGNLFFDTTGGFVGLARAVFAPIASNHQLPFASLPSVTEFRNGIIYCPDGGGGSSRPALAVSDGVKWWQIVLGQFAGNVDSTGAAQTLPRGWTSSKAGAGVYTITHNLGLSANSYAVVATPRGVPGTGYCSGWALSSNTFEIYFSNPAGAATDMDFSFMLNII